MRITQWHRVPQLGRKYIVVFITHKHAHLYMHSNLLIIKKKNNFFFQAFIIHSFIHSFIPHQPLHQITTDCLFRTSARAMWQTQHLTSHLPASHHNNQDLTLPMDIENFVSSLPNLDEYEPTNSNQNSGLSKYICDDFKYNHSHNHTQHRLLLRPSAGHHQRHKQSRNPQLDPPQHNQQRLKFIAHRHRIWMFTSKWQPAV